MRSKNGATPLGRRGFAEEIEPNSVAVIVQLRSLSKTSGYLKHHNFSLAPRYLDAYRYTQVYEHVGFTYKSAACHFA